MTIFISNLAVSNFLIIEIECLVISLLYRLRAGPCEKTGPKNQWFKPVVSENKSLIRKKLITGLKKLTSGFWDLAKIS